MSLQQRISRVLGVGVLAAAGTIALGGVGHGADYLLRVSQGRLQTGAEVGGAAVYPVRVNRGVFGESGIANLTDEPGFDAEAGPLIPGMSVGFDLVGPLRAWDPDAGFASVSADRVTVRKSGIGTQTPPTDSVVPGIVFGQADLDAAAGFHHHVQFILNPAQGGAPDGLWLLGWELWTDAPGIERTEPLYIVFAQGSGVSGLDEAVAWVEDHLVAQACVADLAAPFGVLNFFDVSAFIALYNAQDHDADLAAPSGVWNFFDVSAFIAAYNAGCP